MAQLRFPMPAPTMDMKMGHGHVSFHFFTLLLPSIYSQDEYGDYVEGEIEVHDVSGYYAVGPVVSLG